jgi:ABC-type glycerol-3-phosphate transport system permease component
VSSFIAPSRRGRLMRQGNWWRIAILGILAFLTFLPLVETVIISFKSIPQFDHQPFLPTLPLNVVNYLTAWNATYRYLWNSIYVCSVSVVVTLVCACLSAYTFARFRFPLKSFLFYFLLALLMIPSILSLVTRFIMVKNMGLLNTQWALIIPYVSGGQVFMIFVARTFFESLPEELFESARLDGAREIRILWSIVLPMSRPIIWTLMILNVNGNWNNILWPMITLSKQMMYPITVGLMYFRNEYLVDRGLMMAGYVIASVPMLILFTVASKQFIEGLSSGALKM